MLEIGGGVADVCKVTMAQLHQVVTLRRDLLFLKKKTGHVFAPLTVSRRVVGFSARDFEWYSGSVAFGSAKNAVREGSDNASTVLECADKLSAQAYWCTPVTNSERKRQRKNPARRNLRRNQLLRSLHLSRRKASNMDDYHVLYRDGRSAPRFVPPGTFCPRSLDFKTNPVPL